jgi:hydrogenase-4 component B
MDDLTSIFLIPILLISSLGSIYGLEYWSQRRHPRNAGQLQFYWGWLAAGMMMVVLARDGVLFLIAWEIMALAAFFLIATEDAKPQTRSAAWVYLVAAHCGTLCLLAMFGLLRLAGGSLDLWPSAAADLPHWLTAAVFITGLLGFGLKAGLMPLHVWLPPAHANAPSHASAILSGAMLNTGVYGLIRITSWLDHPPLWCGATLLVAGAVSAVMGIAFAAAQDDFKRLLAYSSVENIGIVTLGIGLAVLGRSFNHLDWIVLGLGGALLHMLNHSLFKPLLFMGAGSVLHETRTRRIDLLGGLAGKMPRTYILFLVGSVAICGLPPLNGFVSEWLIFMGLFRTAGIDAGATCNWAALAAPALAMTGAIALAAFVKLVGIVFEGSPRSSAGAHAHDPGPHMLGPMIVLAACCLLIGIAPVTVLPLIDRAVAAWDSRPSRAGLSIGSLIPLPWLSLAAGAILAAIAAGTFLLRQWRRSHQAAAEGTWACGYVRPGATMQYTGSSFSQTFSPMFAWALLPRRALVGLNGIFPGRWRFSSETPDTVLDRALLPACSLAERVLSWARLIQHGRIQVYVLYMLIVVVALLLVAGWAT